jgi:hypothetical protein
MDMKPVYQKFGVSKWVRLGDPLERAANRHAENVIRSALRHTPPSAELPAIFGPDRDGRGGGPVRDPLTIYVALPFGATDQDSVVYSVRLAALLNDEAVDMLTDGSDLEGFELIAAALEDLSKKANRLVNQGRIARRLHEERGKPPCQHETGHWARAGRGKLVWSCAECDKQPEAAE